MFVAPPGQAEVSEGLAELPGARLWYWDTGGDGAPIVLCHPASQSCQAWAYQQPRFAAAGYRVIGYSRRGYYRSERGPESDHGTTVGDLGNLLDHLNIRQAHVIGAAAGGITALAFAMAHPSRVISVILAGTIFSLAEDDWRSFYGRLGLEAVRNAVSTEFLELGPSYRLTQPEGAARFAELSALAHAGSPLRQPSGVAVSWEMLAQNKVPALLVTGEADLYAPPPLQNKIAERLANCETQTLREVGHAAYWEAPEAFNEIVLDFLARR